MNSLESNELKRQQKPKSTGLTSGYVTPESTQESHAAIDTTTSSSSSSDATNTSKQCRHVTSMNSVLGRLSELIVKGKDHGTNEKILEIMQKQQTTMDLLTKVVIDLASKTN